MSTAQIQQEIALAQQEFRAGRLDAAETRIQRLAAKYPDRAEVLIAKGVIEASRGEQERAFDTLTAALALAPSSAEALGWATYVALNLHRFAEAEGLARRFATVAPSISRPHYLLASALRGQHRIADALRAIDRALAIDPNDVESMVTKARLLQSWQMPNQATELYRKAMKIRPNPAAGVELARMLLRDGHYESSLEILREVKALLPANERPYALFGQAYTLLHRFEEGDAQWAMARQQTGNHPSVTQSQATAEIAAGRFDVAERLLFELIERGQDLPTSFSILTTGRKMKPDDRSLIERMVDVSRGALPPAQAIALNYALGKSFDDLREFERAMSHFDEANRVCFETYPQRRGFDPEEWRRLTDFLIGLKIPDRAKGLPDEFPLFVVGMMRSGTTLTETILSNHSRVKGGGEQSFWTERAIDFILPKGSSYTYDHEKVLGFAKQYLSLVAPGDDAIRYVVDKNPENATLAGILHAAFPNAKILHLKRHPVDNMLSLWMTPVSANVRYVSNKANLLAAYRQHARLWKHWQSVLSPDRFQSYRYEDLTSNPGEVIPEMMDFLGLENEDATLTPERNVRSVLTPSVYQVRQPIHRGSQERWRNYEPWLGEFSEALDDPDLV